MIIDRKMFFKIPRGIYSVGLDDAAIHSLLDDRSLAGSDINSAFLYNSYPRHEIDLKECLISRNLVTVNDFRTFVEETGYVTEAERDGWGWVWEDGWLKKHGASWLSPCMSDDDILYRQQGDVVPVLQVSCNDAEEYCRYLSMKAGERIRLPSEWEWEAMAGVHDISLKNMPMVHGKREEDRETFMDILCHSACGNTGFHPTGLVWEWTMNWFKAYPGGVENREFGEVYRVLKGGSLLSLPLQRNRSYRFRRCPTARSPFYGFRVCLENSD